MKVGNQDKLGTLHSCSVIVREGLESKKKKESLAISVPMVWREPPNRTDI